eukprot:6639013-Pyramimonas_sp.AAC.1
MGDFNVADVAPDSLLRPAARRDVEVRGQQHQPFWRALLDFRMVEVVSSVPTHFCKHTQTCSTIDRS